MYEVVRKILDIEREQKIRLNNNKLRLYNSGDKIHLKQIEFHKTDKKNRWVFGGNRSGKTECGAVEVVYTARGCHPYRKIQGATEGWVVSLTSQVQRDVAQKKILYYLNPDWITSIVMSSGRKDSPQNGIIDYILVRNVFGSLSRIGFKNQEQGREKFQGTSLDYVWFDEEPVLDIYIECKMRLLDRNGYMWGTMTPLKGLTFIYTDIYLNEKNDPNIWYEFMQWDDNPYISVEAKKMLESSLSSDELRARKYGEFMSFGGLVYSEFDERVNVIEPFDIPIDWYDLVSIDPGLKNPLSCHFYARDYDGNVYVVAEHYESDKPIDYHAKKILEIADRLNWHRGFNGKLQALIDSAANQRTLASEKSVTMLFDELGISCNTDVNKDLFSGINKVKSYIRTNDGKRHLFIFKSCVNMIREIKGYFWGNDDAPIKKDDHAMDELRYYLMFSKLKVKKVEDNSTEISRHKARLINRLKKYE